MSYQERIFREAGNDSFEWVVRNGQSYCRCRTDGFETSSGFSLQDLEASEILHEVEGKPAALSHAELTALRRFRETVMAATQTESNSRLPMAIFAADAEVRRVIKPEVAHV